MVASIRSSWILDPTNGSINTFLRSVGITEGPDWLGSPNLAIYSVMAMLVWLQIGYPELLADPLRPSPAPLSAHPGVYRTHLGYDRDRVLARLRPGTPLAGRPSRRPRGTRHPGTARNSASDVERLLQRIQGPD